MVFQDVKAGYKVAVWSGAGRSPEDSGVYPPARVEIVEVDRVTETQVILKCGRRFSRRSGACIPLSFGGPRLTPADVDAVYAAQQKQRFDSLKQALVVLDQGPATLFDRVTGDEFDSIVAMAERLVKEHGRK